MTAMISSDPLAHCSGLAPRYWRERQAAGATGTDDTAPAATPTPFFTASGTTGRANVDQATADLRRRVLAANGQKDNQISPLVAVPLALAATVLMWIGFAQV